MNHKRKKRVGIMGGTFNPIHIGHLLLAENARENFELDEVLFIPNGCSYMKDSREVAGKELRLEMTKLAIEDNPFFVLSTIEAEREGNSYTYETLELLTGQQPDTEFFFLLGADSLFAMEAWKHPEIIFQKCTVLAAVRDDKDNSDLEEKIAELKAKYNAAIYQISLKEICISSTDIRNRIKKNKSIRYMVPEPVISYIRKNHLYQNEQKETVKSDYEIF